MTISTTSFLTGIAPEKFKMARVIPISRKGSQTSLNNTIHPFLYSLFLINLLEKLIYKQIIDFLNKRSLIYRKQFRFRSHY